MHASLLRRINIQRSDQLSKIGINPLTNFFCIGDSKGFLQIINYPQIVTQTLPLSREESFSQNQNCFQFISNINHKSAISLISWNACYDKLTTVDSDGVLVVWKKKNGFFDEEMVNNREESYIKDIKWSKNGEYICFIYDDGQIYTGLVDGNHEWYNDVDKGISFVEFSPDNKKILIAKKKEKIYIFNISGQQIGEFNFDQPYNEYDIVSIDWWCDYRRYYNENMIYNEENISENNNNNILNSNNNNNKINMLSQHEEILIKDNINENDYNKFSKHLMIAFRNGIILFFDDENDKQPKMVKTELTIILGAQWEPRGTYFVVAGNINDSKDDNKSENYSKSIALIYSLEGDLIKMVICPNKIFSFSMGNSTTVALESQKIIYTGFIKYDYKWTFFSNTIVVGYLIGDNKYNIIYLDIENNAKLCKNINNLLGIISNDSFCILLIENKDNVYNIIFTNNFGNLLDNKKCPIKPLIYTINNEYLVISDGDYIYILIFRYNSLNKKNINDKSNSNIIIGKNVFNNNKLDNKLMKEIIFFIDDENIDINNNEYNYNTFKENNNNKLTNDKIIYMSLSINYLFIARSFGEVYQYDISTLKLEKKFRFEEKIKKFGISPFETYLWTIDKNDILRLHNIKYQEKDEEKNKKIKDFYQKDVWEIEWVHNMEDFDENFNDTLNFVTVERNKLYFYSNLRHEGDPYVCTDYLAVYIDNEATAVKLEDLINNKNNQNLNPNIFIKKYQNKILSKFNNMLDTGKKLDEIYEYVKKNPSKKLWRRLSQNALENLDFDTAQKSMLQMNDFNGLEFLNNVKNIKDAELQKAEIAQYNSNYEEASKLFKKNNRSDLDLAMNMKLGKWDQVSQILNKDKNDKNKNTKEEYMKLAYNNYADELFEKKEFDKAEENYHKSGNIKGLTNCYFAKEEYDKAVKMLEVIPEEDEFLDEIGEKFLGLGMCHEAVLAFTKKGNIKKGLESYISCNKWEEAIDLSSKNNFLYMEELVNKFSDQFRLSGKKLDLVNLYKKANMSVEVHKYLCEIAQDMRKFNLNPIFIKKIFVLAALELERYKAQINQQIYEENLINDDNENNINKKKINYIDEALQKDIDKITNNHWRGAEAYHFYLLCQAQLHQKKYKESCKTAMRLKFYEDILGVETVYKLIAICSYMNKCYKIFANALIVLSNDESINKNIRRKFQNFSKDFFLKNKPENINENFYECPNPECDEAISEYDTYCNVCGYVLSGCVLSGRSILDNKYFKCNQCRSRTIKSEVKKKPFKNCPLCHKALFKKKKEE
jgi:WD repeat-containing protein 35